MADEVGRDLPSFLTSVLDKTGYICQNDVGEGTAEAHAEVIDQSIRMPRSILLEIHCRDIRTSEVRSWINLQPLLRTSYHLFKSSQPLSPETAAKNNCFAPGNEEKKTPRIPRFDIIDEILEELRV